MQDNDLHCGTAAGIDVERIFRPAQNGKPSFRTDVEIYEMFYYPCISYISLYGIKHKNSVAKAVNTFLQGDSCTDMILKMYAKGCIRVNSIEVLNLC